jgi:hypothetical protein
VIYTAPMVTSMSTTMEVSLLLLSPGRLGGLYNTYNLSPYATAVRRRIRLPKRAPTSRDHIYISYIYIYSTVALDNCLYM